MSAVVEETPLYHSERGSLLWKALRVIWLLNRGVTTKELAKEFCCADLTARRWLRVAEVVLPVEVRQVSAEDPKTYRLMMDWEARLRARQEW